MQEPESFTGSNAERNYQAAVQRIHSPSESVVSTPALAILVERLDELHERLSLNNNSLKVTCNNVFGPMPEPGVDVPDKDAFQGHLTGAHRAIDRLYAIQDEIAVSTRRLSEL